MSTIPMNRKSLVVACEIKTGQIITKDMLEIKRPGTGIEPKYYDLIIGKKAIVDIPDDEVITWEMFLDGSKMLIEH